MKTKTDILRRLNELSEAERKLRQDARKRHGEKELNEYHRQLDEIDIERQHLETQLDAVKSEELTRGLGRT